MNKMNAYAVAAGLFTLTAVGGVAVYTVMAPTSDDPFVDCRTSVVAGGTSQIGGPFTLVDENGVTVTDQDVLDVPSLIYFGYTYCPDVCPLDAARNSEAVALLGEQGYEVQPVFITIDPERDTPQLLKEFTDYLHPDMLGLTGTTEQVKAASKAYRTYFKKQDGDPEYYLMDHSTFSYLTLPDHGFVEFFRREIRPEMLAEQIACFMDAK